MSKKSVTKKKNGNKKCFYAGRIFTCAQRDRLFILEFILTTVMSIAYLIVSIKWDQEYIEIAKRTGEIHESLSIFVIPMVLIFFFGIRIYWGRLIYLANDFILAVIFRKVSRNLIDENWIEHERFYWVRGE